MSNWHLYFGLKFFLFTAKRLNGVERTTCLSLTLCTVCHLQSESELTI